ncbi:MAG: hypothetical protein KF795_11855 [Labilithrix sp.]|nr:hypothetical protein [Labilithrix sp.]
MKWERWHAVAAAAAIVAAGLVAFGKCGGSSPAADAGVVAEPPARAPDDLLADVYVSSPNPSWTRLQRGVGGAVGILPATLPGVLVALTELDVAFVDEIDGTAPMFGVLAGDPASPSAAFAMKLVDARRARRLLADGDVSRFTAKEANGMTLLLPHTKDAEARPFELAITQNGYLVVARDAADLERLAPYATRTLPSRPLPTESAVAVDVPKRALQAVLKPRVESLWGDGKSFLLTQDEQMRAARGRAPDFGDPAAIVAALDGLLERRVAILGDLEKLRVSLEITEDAAVLTATLTPLGGGGPAERWVDGMKLGDAAPVLALPTVSALALSMRDGEGDRDEQGKELEKAIATSLGPRLKDPGKLHEVIEALTKARDESLAVALGLDEPAGLLVRAPVRDAAAVDTAIRGAFDLTKAEPFKELLGVRDVTATSAELPDLGKVAVATVLRVPKETKRGADATPRAARGADGGAPAARAASGEAGAAWVVDRGTLSLGAGHEPLVTLKTGTRPDRTLADEPSLRRFTAAVASDASTVIVAQPLRLDPKRANLPAAPLAIAVGRKGRDAFVRVDIADGILREAARWQMGF